MMRRLMTMAVMAVMLIGMAGKAFAADCVSPPGPEGSIMYNTNYNAMQYCDGYNWVQMGGIASSPNALLSGDVTTVAGSGSAAATIANNAVTYAKMQDISATSRLLGRYSAGAGDPQEITIGSGLSLSGTTLSTVSSNILSALTTSGRDALSQVNGMAVLNTDTNLVNIRAGGQWVAFGSLYATGEAPSVSFTDQTGVVPSTLTTSNTITVTLNGSALPVPVSVSGAGSPQININGTGWVTSGSIYSGQTLQVQLTSSSSNSTANAATVVVGGTSDTWNVTTRAAPTTLTFVASSNGSGTTVSRPAGAQAGDIWIIFAGPANVSTLSGFTLLSNTTDGTTYTLVFGKITGTETSATLGVSASWISAVFRPNNPASTLTWVVGGAQYTTGDPSVQTIPSSSTTSYPIVLLGAMASNGVISPRSTSPVMSEIAGPSTQLYAHYKIYNSSAVNHTYDMDDEGANSLQSGYLKVQ